MSHNFLLVGFGSMGKRRARLLSEIDPDIKLTVVDSSAERREQASGLGYNVFEDLNNALSVGGYTASLICSAPLTHPEITKKLLENGLCVFSELNLTDECYPELCELAKNSGLLWFNSNTMLYRREIVRIIEHRKEFSSPVCYRYHIGQYLPDWHPWESYKNFFVGDKRTSGIREILAIELAWLIEAFGSAEVLNVQRRRLSSLEIEYDDTAFITLLHADGTLGTLLTDVVSPKPVRDFELFGEGLHLFWEGSPTTLSSYDIDKKEKVNIPLYENATQLKSYSDNIVEDAYRDELNNFIASLDGNESPKYSYEHNLEVLETIEIIERDA